MEHEDLLPCTQEPTIALRPKPDESSAQPPILFL
jgi:hypothetical protein